jgi:hypothetical protein
MKRLLHRYIRRLINWLNTPSDEEVVAAAKERRMARLSYDLGAPPNALRYRGLSDAELQQAASEIGTMIDERGYPPKSAAARV